MASDLTNAEWAILEPLAPPRPKRGRPTVWDYRLIVEAILYLLHGGLPWRMLPPGLFPPMTTVRHYFYRWSAMGVWESINHALLLMAREAAGRESSRNAGVIDNQSVKTAESGGTRGFDAGKKLKGRKRHIVTDTQGLLVDTVVHTADIQDRDGTPDVLASIRGSFPWLRCLFADGGYAGETLHSALAKIGEWTLEIIKRSNMAKGSSCYPAGGWSSEPSKAPPQGSSSRRSTKSLAESQAPVITPDNYESASQGISPKPSGPRRCVPSPL